LKYFYFFLLVTTFVFGQGKKIEKVDSVTYFMELAKYYKTKNNYKLCLSYFQKSYNQAVIKEDTKGIANSLSALGTCYFELKKNKDAIESYSESILQYSKLQPSIDQALTYYKLGLCYMELEDYAKAERNFEQSRVIYTSKNIDASAMLNLQKGIVYKMKGKYAKATELFNQIIFITENQDYYSLRAKALYHQATIEEMLGRNNLAINYLNRALDLNQKSNDLELNSQIYFALSTTNEKINKPKLSLEYLKNHNSSRDKIQNEINKKLGYEDYRDFKESEQLNELEKLNKENEAQQKEAKFAKLISILSITLIIILSLLSFSLYKNNIIRNQSNIVLKQKNLELEIAKDKAEKASQARAEFLSTVSHELRTPLNAINGITHLLLEENPKESQMQYLNSLKFSGNYLLTFINEILEINRIESKNIQIEYIDFNLKQLLLNIKNTLKELANINKNKIILEIDGNLPDSFSGDPTMLSQIFMNLINNSLKFTENGSVKVIVNQVSNIDDIVQIYFEIQDTGIGIPEDKIESIFDSFSQGSVEINRKYGGTGLGLAIVRRLVELLGGTIQLKSEVNVGTSFFFELGLKVSDKKVKKVKATAINEEIIKDKMVLVVEDNKINQMVTKKMLEQKGMKCKIIDNGEEAIEVMQTENVFDLVLMDVHLPGINGTVATEHIRKFNTQTPIIALTAISLNENREMLLSFGMDEVITKPFDPEVFYRTIAQTIAGSELNS
jgi:signal transduction histidine kinase/CheY-like chemotaxis protein